MPPNINSDSCAVCLLPSVHTINFGRRSCKACAAFFRRTVSFSNKYTCVADANCNVHYEKRMICKKCRFDKCLAVDMNPDLVRSKAGDAKTVPSDPSDSPPSTSFENDEISTTIEFYTRLESRLNDRRRLLYNSANVDEVFGKICECPFDRDCIVEFDFNDNRDYRPNIIMMVDYVRGYPNFDKLSAVEQSIFYRNCFAVDATLNCAWYSIKINGREQFSISQYAYYMEMDPLPPPLEQCKFRDELATEADRTAYSILRQGRIDHWFGILKPMEKLNLNFTEFSLFKAFVCWNVCMSRFSKKSRAYCEIEKSKLLNALMKECSREDTDGSQRIGELIMFMIPVNEELQRLLSELVMVTTFDVYAILDPMVKDILDYKKW